MISGTVCEPSDDEDGCDKHCPPGGHQISNRAAALKNKPFLKTFVQDYSNCHESITEKLVVIDVSDVIGEAIRYLLLCCNGIEMVS